MIIQGSEDLRVQKTMAAIDAAFSALVLEKDLDAITVTEICRRARIQRKTFYAYYPSVDALLREKLDVMSRGYIERIRKYAVPEQMAEINREFYRYSSEQGELYDRIVCGAGYRGVGSSLLGGLVRKTWEGSPWFKSLGPWQQDLLLTFIYSTGAGLYRRWVEGGRQIPLEEMATYAGSLLEQGVQGFARAVRGRGAGACRQAGA